MLVIRSQQFNAFESVANETLCLDIAKFLRENHSATRVFLETDTFRIEQLPAETLNTLINTGLRRARTIGMTWESSLASFVVMMFVVAPNFDQQSGISKELQNKLIEPDERIEKVWKTTTDDDWEEAAQNYDAKVWNFSAEEPELNA